MLIEPFRNFAILAPVPARHLISGSEKLVQDRLEYLAFGSGKIRENTSLRTPDLFHAIDHERARQPVVLLIYPSHEQPEEKPPFEVCWTGWYVGHVYARADGLYPESDPWKHRPPTCKANYEYNPETERWTLYWRAKALQLVSADKRIDISVLERERPVRPWPLGPEVVRGESWWPILDVLRSADDA